MNSKSSFCILLASILTLFFTGCITPLSIKNDKELTSLIKAYENHAINLEKRNEERRTRGINVLTVEKNGDLFNVNAELDNASISTVVNQLFDKTGIPYILDDMVLRGNITACFNKIPLLEALNLILNPGALKAVLKNGVVAVQYGLYDDIQPDTANVEAEVIISNLDMTTISTLLSGLYPANPATGERLINFGPIPNTNTIYITGPKHEVARTVKLLTKADREIKHIMLEVVLVEFDSNEFEKVDANIADFATDKFSGVNLNFGSFAESAVSFTRDASASNPTKFTAVIDILISEEKARLISRPYVATLSGNEAVINITNNRFIITETAQNGATIVAPSPITSGVVLKITPTILPDDIIRMDLYIEDSQFSEALNNVAVEVDKNSASSRMHIQDGKTIIIGGLVSNKRSWGNAGLPFLRKVPFINSIFSKQIKSNSEREVAIYLTPHIWSPNFAAPILEKEAFSVK